MHSLIISLFDNLKKSKTKKHKHQHQKNNNLQKIFDSIDYGVDKKSELIEIKPYIYQGFTIEKLLTNGITIPKIPKNVKIISIIGEIGVGKTKIISQLLQLPIVNVVKKNLEILSYQFENLWLIEYQIDWNNHESRFICDILQKISDNTIFINSSSNKQILSNFDNWKNIMIIHKCFTNQQQQFIIDTRKLKQYNQISNCYYKTKNIHIFYKENQTIELLQMLLSNTQLKKIQILQSLQSVINQATYLLPFKLEFIQQDKLIKLNIPLKNKIIVDQYIKDYYEENEQILKFIKGEDYILVQMTREYLRMNCKQILIENSELIIKLALRDLRFNFIIPFIYKRQCQFQKVKQIIEQEEFMILKFIS